MVRSKLYYHIFLYTVVLFLLFLSGNVQGKDYKDDNERYSIWYPETWERTEIDYVDIAFVDPKYDNFRENLNVISIYVSGVRNTQDFVLDACDEGIKEIKKNYFSVNIISQPTAYQINGHWGATYVYEMKQSGEILRGSQTVITSEGYSYAFIITCTALSDTYNDYETIFSISINSFEILNEPNSLFSGLCLTVGLGALIGGIVCGIIFYMMYSKKKKEEGDITQSVVEVELIKPENQSETLSAKSLPPPPPTAQSFPPPPPPVQSLPPPPPKS